MMYLKDKTFLYKIHHASRCLRCRRSFYHHSSASYRVRYCMVVSCRKSSFCSIYACYNAPLVGFFTMCGRSGSGFFIGICIVTLVPLVSRVFVLFDIRLPFFFWIYKNKPLFLEVCRWSESRRLKTAASVSSGLLFYLIALSGSKPSMLLLLELLMKFALMSFMRPVITLLTNSLSSSEKP